MSACAGFLTGQQINRINVFFRKVRRSGLCSSACKVKVEYSSSQTPHRYGNSRAIRDHTVLGYLPPDRGDIPALTPAEAGTRLSDPGGMQG